MRRSTLAALAAAASLATAQAAQAQDGIFPFEYRKLTLDNGLTAYLVDAGAPNQIAYVSIVRTGSRDEVEEGKTGFAHFFEHMMFRGTKKYPNYDEQTSTIGAARNAFTSNDMTVYYLVAANDYLEKIMDLESDRFQNLEYAEPAFRTEAGAVLGEYQQSATTPFGFLNEKVRELAFDEHTYEHTTIGFEADVRAMPEGFAYSRSFFERFYRPENVVLVIAGDFDFDRAETLIRQYYGDWAPGYVPPDVPVEPAQTAPRTDTIYYQGRTLPVLDVNWKAPAWDADDRIAVATEVLGRLAFGSRSDLYRSLVIEQRLVDYLQSGFGLSRDPDLVSVTAGVPDTSKIDEVNHAILATAERFRQELVDPQLLADTKANMKYGFLMGLETAQNVAFSLIEPIVYTGTLEAIETYYRTLDSITPEDIREAARHVLRDEGRTTVTMLSARRPSDSAPERRRQGAARPDSQAPAEG